MNQLRSNPEPIRVCIVAPSLDILGGQSRQAARLLDGLRAEAALTLDFIPHNPRLPRGLRALQRIKYVRTVVTTLCYWLLLPARLWRYDVIHIFSASYFSYLLSVAPAILIGRLYGRKVLLNYHSGEAADHLQRWPLTTAPVMRLADVIVVPSRYLVEVFARFGLQAHAISNHIELDRFQFRQRAPLRPVFLCNRLLEPLYNVGMALRALQLIQRRHPEARLTIAGDGSERAALERLAHELQLNHVAFIGRVPHECMAELYAAHDVYLNCNDIDNQPASLIECFAAGLPVVTTNAGGIPYLVTHEATGLLVACNDHQAMAAQALRLLAGEALAARLAVNARATAETCGWAATRDEWLRLYHGKCPTNFSLSEAAGSGPFRETSTTGSGPFRETPTN